MSLLFARARGETRPVAIASPWTSGDGACEVGAAGPDVMSGGRAGRDRSLSRRVATALVVALVLGGAIWVTNRQLAAREASTLASCVQTSQQTLAAIDAQLALTAKYVAPQVGPHSSLLIRDSLYRLIENSATGDVPALDGAINRCDQVAIAPPYHRLSAARARLRRLSGRRARAPARHHPRRYGAGSGAA